MRAQNQATCSSHDICLESQETARVWGSLAHSQIMHESLSVTVARQNPAPLNCSTTLCAPAPSTIALPRSANECLASTAVAKVWRLCTNASRDIEVDHSKHSASWSLRS